MPNAGDKLYDCFTGSLRTVTFVSQGLAEGASVPTYILREASGRKFRCAIDMFLPTEREAYQRYLDNCKQAIPGMRKQITELNESLAFFESEIVRLASLLAEPLPTEANKPIGST